MRRLGEVIYAKTLAWEGEFRFRGISRQAGIGQLACAYREGLIGRQKGPILTKIVKIKINQSLYAFFPMPKRRGPGLSPQNLI